MLFMFYRSSIGWTVLFIFLAYSGHFTTVEKRKQRVLLDCTTELNHFDWCPMMLVYTKDIRYAVIFICLTVIGNYACALFILQCRRFKDVSDES